MIARSSPSVSYSMWLRRILDTHVAQVWDADATEVREREDEELNDAWPELADVHKERLWGLSSDLNSLRDRETWVDSDWPAMSEEELGRAQIEAYHRCAWDEFLESLRRPPRLHPRDRVDYLRGRTWRELGHPEVAVLFLDNATRLAPENSNYGLLALDCWKALEDWPEVVKRCETWLDDSATPARLLFRAADALHACAHRTGEHACYYQALKAVELGFDRLKQTGRQEPSASILAGAYATKAFCFAQLGRDEESLRVFDEAVDRFPQNATLLTARGLLKQKLGRPDAIDDFHRAFARGAAVVWPYLELARDALQAGHERVAAELCRQGLPFAQRDPAVALLYQLMAICMFRLNDSTDAVRATFRRAGELDPLNPEIRSNCEWFDNFVADPSAGEPSWHLPAVMPAMAFEDVYAQLQTMAV